MKSSKTIAAYSKFMGYSVGGAEISTLALLAEKYYLGSHIQLISNRGAYFQGSASAQLDMPEEWDKFEIDNLITLNRFSYCEYLFNRNRIKRWFREFSVDELWVYGTFAPAAALGFNGNLRYFIRSETDLGIIKNYYEGHKFLAKKVFDYLQSPATYVYQRDLSYALNKSEVIANSKYIAERTQELFGITPEVVYPPVDVSYYRDMLDADPVDDSWVVFVGDSTVKGLEHVLASAHQLASTNFRIYSRFVNRPKQEENITWMPWEKDAWRVYRGARLVIVPSQWEEAYGRVAREAYLLGIPVLVSNVGGLPEAVDEDQSCLVDDFKNSEAWVQAISNTLSMLNDLESSQ